MTNISESQNRRQHTYKQFDQELADIQSQVFALGGIAEEQVRLSVQSLIDNNVTLAEQVIKDDYKINALEVAIDEVCLHTLARRQPAASDLRLVVAAIKTITDLERIGDDAKRIARCTLGMADYCVTRSRLTFLDEFGGHVRGLLKNALDAMARLDVDLAFQVKQSDRQIDEEYRNIMRQQISEMADDARTIPVALNLIWAAKALERIGDRSCNICEYVVYYVLAKDIRHMTLEQAEQNLRSTQR